MDLTQPYYNPDTNASHCAWDRVSLLESHEWCFTLDDSEQLTTLAPRISDCLEHTFGLVLIKNFPLTANLTHTKKLFIDFVSRLGTPLPQNESDDLVFSVEFRKESADENLNRGPINNESLAFHSDRSDVTALLCCQQAKSGGETKLVSSLRIHQELVAHYPDLIDCLYQPFYYAKANWENHLAYDYVYPLPVFTVREGHFACRYLRPLIDKAYSVNQTLAMSGLQKSALAKLEELANDNLFHVAINLAAGDLLLFNNHTTLHARNAFVDQAQTKRLLLRAWLATANSRPLHPYFLPLFGNCEAGTLRGGFR